MSERSTGLPTQQQVIELLDDEFARAGYDVEDVVIEPTARPPRITVVADSDNGLDLEAVAELSRTASELLDTLDSAAYVLEVSSPGVDRPLTSEKHYRRAHGRLAELALKDGSVLTARIGRIRDGTLDAVVRKVKAGPEIRVISFDEIVKAVVQVEFSPPSARELELAGVSGEETSA